MDREFDRLWLDLDSTQSHLPYAKLFRFDEELRRSSGTIALETMDYDLHTFEVPEVQRRCMEHLLVENDLEYAAFGGTRMLRTAIAAYETGLARNGDLGRFFVLLGNGVSEVAWAVIRGVMRARSNGGRNQFVIVGPTYPLFSSIILELGAVPVLVVGNAENDFVPEIENVAAHVSRKTAGIIIVNPNNPTGIAYSRQFLSALLAIAHASGAVLISDEVYSEMYHGGGGHVSLVGLNSGYRNLIRLFGPSKDRPGFTGIRIGYAAGDASYGASLLNDALVRGFSVGAIPQWWLLVDLTMRLDQSAREAAGLATLLSKEQVANWRGCLAANMNRIEGLLSDVLDAYYGGGLFSGVVIPNAGNMILVRLRRRLGEQEFLEEMRARKVVLYPGSFFDIPDDQTWTRLCLTRRRSVFRHGLSRLAGL